MNASELLTQTQQFYVNSDLGTSVTVQYVHMDGTNIPELNVFRNEAEFNRIKSDKKEAVANFTNVFLDQEPCQNDKIKVSGEDNIWRVQKWKRLDGMYNIEATSKRYSI